MAIRPPISRLVLGSDLLSRSGPTDAQAHPPIHPTKGAGPGELTNPDEQKIYELVVRHFLACCADDAKGNKTHVTVEMGGESFSATGEAFAR